MASQNVQYVLTPNVVSSRHFYFHNVSSTQELDLLEDIRKYLKARVALEVQYADGMQKLSTTFLAHKSANVPDIQTSDNEQVRANSGRH